MHFELKYSIQNDLELDLSIQVLVNQKASSKITHQRSESDCGLVWDTDLILGINTLHFVFAGQEQENKKFTIHSLTINNQPINVLAAFYYADTNSWWEGLDTKQLAQAKKQIINHGGHFGWFGTVEYEISAHHSRQKNNLLGIGQQRVCI
jgi:hypothetical protein